MYLSHLISNHALFYIPIIPYRNSFNRFLFIYFWCFSAFLKPFQQQPNRSSEQVSGLDTRNSYANTERLTRFVMNFAPDCSLFVPSDSVILITESGDSVVLAFSEGSETCPGAIVIFCVIVRRENRIRRIDYSIPRPHGRQVHDPE